MSKRPASNWLLVLASSSLLACNESGDGAAGEDETVESAPTCAGATCSEASGGAGAPNGSQPEGPAPEPNGGAPSGPNAGGSGSGTDNGGADDGGDDGTSGMPNPSSGSPSTPGGAAGTPSPEPEPSPSPEPAAGGSAPTTSGGAGAGPEPTPGMPDAGSPGPAPEPDTPAQDAGPSSSRLTAVPVGSTDAGLGYWEYLPPNYGSEPAPLLVFTHGASWQGQGTEETLQKLLEVGPPNLQSTDAWPNERPFVVLSPQNPRSGCFDPDDIDVFYRYVVEAYDVDPQRIYHTGQSCGAIGAWNYLAAHLDEFVTAAVLISGDGQAAFDQAGCELGRVAIWGLHNELDMSVNSQGTINPINALLACDPPADAKLTIYPGETAHDAWTKTYDLSAGNDIYAWLLEHVHP